MQKRRLTEAAGMRAASPDLNSTEPAMLYADTGILRIQFDQWRSPGASASLERRYFDRLDADTHLKIIERQILESMVEFLDAKNIDTKEFKKQQITILNSGLIVTGGALNTESLAVGPHAKAETIGGDAPGGNDGYKHVE